MSRYVSIYIGKVLERDVNELIAKGHTVSDIFKAGVYYLKHGQKVEDSLKTKWYEIDIRISSIENRLSTMQLKLNELSTKVDDLKNILAMLSNINDRLAEIEKILLKSQVAQSSLSEQQQ